jgi:hypothetical protein
MPSIHQATHTWTPERTKPQAGEIARIARDVQFDPICSLVAPESLGTQGRRRSVFLAPINTPGQRGGSRNARSAGLRVVDLDDIGPVGLLGGLGAAVAAEEHDRGHEDDLQVQPQRSVADVPLVELLFSSAVSSAPPLT